MIWWMTTLAWADPAVLLAPAPAELAAAEQELERRVLDAEAIGRATSRLQNATAHLEDPCDGGFTLRARAFAGAWRDAAQRARVQADRTRTIAASPTLTPLVDEARTASIEQMAARAELQAASWLEFDRLEGRSRVRCDGPLQPAAGLPDPTPRAIGETGMPVAVWVITGTLCPGARDVQGVAVVRGPVCVDLDPACACDLREMQPGAVLAP